MKIYEIKWILVDLSDEFDENGMPINDPTNYEMSFDNYVWHDYMNDIRLSAKNYYFGSADYEILKVKRPDEYGYTLKLKIKQEIK